MNIFAWPPGTHMILAALSALDPKNDKKDYNKKVRRFAKYGMIYKVHGFNNEYESICPFCKLKRKNYHFRRSCQYTHSSLCRDCVDFKKN
ncbi:hypothetical protein M9Y10_031875 [Tritrichomonas musculus]|uniref:Uncharacterized protein n=1 Tax=Tritrichomonas musculus TaxID=1915356 RepID=A0ABR2H039_9EUKA